MRMKLFFFRSGHLVWTLLALAAMRPAVAQDANVFLTVTIHATDSRASEGGSDTGTFTVRRSGATNFPLAVFYQLSGSASNGADYERLGSSVQIPAGSLAASITVKPLDDTLVEGDETVVAQIVGSPLACITCGYNIGVPSNAVAVITDNDGPPTTNHPPFVQLNAPQDGEVFAAGAGIALQAYAQDAEDGYDLKVEFFEGTNSLGFGTFVPTLCPSPFCPFYALVWSNVPPGQYTLTARATDSAGATSVSQPARITVGGTNVVRQPVVNIFATDATGREIPVVPPWLGMAQESDPIVFTVTRTGPTNIPLAVFYAIGGTASNGIDYSIYPPAGNDFGQHGRVTIPAGASSVDIQAWVMDDLFVEGTETVELTVEPPVCIQIFPPPPECYLVGPNKRALGSILDNDLTPAPVVTIVATDPNASESGPDNGVFTVSRTGDTNNPLWVYYAIGGTAQTGIDYLAFTNIDPFLHTFGGFPNVQIPAGASSVNITVTPIDDALAEGSETVRLQLQQPAWANYLVGTPGNAVLTIADNDQTNAPRVVNIIARDPFASEGTNFWLRDGNVNNWSADVCNLWHVNVGGTNTATFVVRRQGPTEADLTVNYGIGGTASNGADYVTLPASITIAAGKHTAQIVVRPIDDALIEGIETVVLTLAPSADYAVGFPSHAAAIIIDNDRPRPPCVRLRDGLFHLCGPAMNGFSFRVETSGDLRSWIPICTNVVTDGALHFVDPDAANLQHRFYRVHPEPAVPSDD